MITTTARDHYQRTADAAQGKLLDHFGITYAEPLIITWELRGRSRLGYARGSREIHLNQGYADVMGTKAYTEVVLHEVAHTITVLRMRRAGQSRQTTGPWSSHGSEWAKAMRVLGLQPHRCGQVDEATVLAVKPGRTVARITVSCACRTHEITIAKRNKVKAGTLTLTCRNCKMEVK